MQEGTNLTQIEVVVLEEASFLFLEKSRCPLINLVKDNIFKPVNQPPGCHYDKSYSSKPHYPTTQTQKITHIESLCNYPLGITTIVQLSPYKYNV
jgi:hypothetical protein